MRKDYNKPIETLSLKFLMDSDVMVWFGFFWFLLIFLLFQFMIVICDDYHTQTF